MNPDNEPNPILIKLAGAVIALAMIAFGVFMGTQQGSVFGDAPEGQQEPGLFVSVIDWLWGWPVGVVLILFGVLVFVGIFARRKPTPTDLDGPSS